MRLGDRNRVGEQVAGIGLLGLLLSQGLERLLRRPAGAVCLVTAPLGSAAAFGGVRAKRGRIAEAFQLGDQLAVAALVCSSPTFT